MKTVEKVKLKYLYTFKNRNGDTFTTKNVKDFCKLNHLNDRSMYHLVNGKRKTHKGWVFVSKIKLK